MLLPHFRHATGRRMRRLAPALCCWLLLLLGSGAAAQAQNREPATFKDMLGERVRLAQPARQSVTLPMPAGSLLIALAGSTDKLAGMHPDAHAYMQDGLLGRMFPGAPARIRADVTRGGFAPNVETLLQMQPDLIWQWGHMGDDLIAPLRNAGLPVAALLYGNETRTREWIGLMGASLGQSERAQAHLAWRRDVEQRIRAVTARLSEHERPRVMLLSRYRPEMRAASSASNFQFDVELAGGRNVAASVGNANAVNIEQIMAWNPQVILLNNFEPGLSPQSLYDDPLFAGIDAVRNQRVYRIPAGGYRWDPPGQESPLYWQWLSMVLHPQRFDWPMRQLIRDSYRALYGYEATEADLDFVLHTQLNARAQGYARFLRANAERARP
ncbi:MAG: ABC transporter substrate-binding protein [Burkholderiaceae bacterium]|jgi:iron complex transport system substrate-binding protein|nr:ABC transporter substrate-binding protein [Burkholderiaceae bacterium]